MISFILSFGYNDKMKYRIVDNQYRKAINERWKLRCNSHFSFYCLLCQRQKSRVLSIPTLLNLFCEPEKWFCNIPARDFIGYLQNSDSRRTKSVDAVVVRLVATFASHLEGRVFESRSWQTEVYNENSQILTAKRLATGVNVTGPRRWP